VAERRFALVAGLFEPVVVLLGPEDEAETFSLLTGLVDFCLLDNERTTKSFCWTVNLFVHGFDDLMMKESF